jgi:hypothetical protein
VPIVNTECSKFGTIDIVTNECNYEKALNVRKDDHKCSEEAVFFKRNYFKFITVPYYFLVENSFEVLLFYLLYLYLYSLLNKVFV